MRHHTLLLSLLSTLSLTLVACGGDSLGSDPVTAAQAEDPCRTGCEHEAECSDDPAYDLEGCVDDCVADTSGWVRGDALEALAMPALLVPGADPTHPPEVADVYRRHLRRLTVVEVGAGIDRPGLAAAVDAFAGAVWAQQSSPA